MLYLRAAISPMHEYAVEWSREDLKVQSGPAELLLGS